MFKILQFYMVGNSMKVRSFSGVTEIEDIFDAVFKWMGRPGASKLVEERQKIIREDDEEVEEV